MKVADNNSMWAPILEKALAKVKGSYAQTDGGFVVNGLRSTTGVPVFTYQPGSSSYTYTNAQTYELLKAAEDSNYILGAGTAAGVNTQTNDCGLPYSHAFAILSVFKMDGTEMILMRNPWGTTSYTGPWRHDDPNWTASKAAQVPFGIDPRTSNADGIFTMPLTTFLDTS